MSDETQMGEGFADGLFRLLGDSGVELDEEPYTKTH
jgi:hypothetical protein